MAEQCNKPAEVQYMWAGQLLYMCKDHAKGVAVVGNAIGMPVMFVEYQGEEKCSSYDELPEEAEADSE